MLVAVLTIGGIGAAITIAALMARRSVSVDQPPPKVRPIDGGTDPKNDTKPVTPPADDSTGGSNVGQVLGKIGAQLGGLIAGIDPPEDDTPPAPDPGPPSGPDPYSPSPVPRPADYYQVVKGDTLWEISRAAYGAGSRYPMIVSAEENRWLRKPPATTWKGGLYARYNGWNTVWDSGTKYPVLWIPADVGSF